MSLKYQVLASENNIGYEDIQNITIVKFNGEKIDNLKQLASLVDESIKDESKAFLRFDLEGNRVVILKQSEVVKVCIRRMWFTCFPCSLSRGRPLERIYTYI